MYLLPQWYLGLWRSVDIFIHMHIPIQRYMHIIKYIIRFLKTRCHGRGLKSQKMNDRVKGSEVQGHRQLKNECDAGLETT